jgi:hypothetical protein
VRDHPTYATGFVTEFVQVLVVLRLLGRRRGLHRLSRVAVCCQEGGPSPWSTLGLGVPSGTAGVVSPTSREQGLGEQLRRVHVVGRNLAQDNAEEVALLQAS